MAHAHTKEERKKALINNTCRYICEDERSLDDISKASDIRIRQLSKYLNGTAYPSRKSVIALSRAFNIPIWKFYDVDSD